MARKFKAAAIGLLTLYAIGMGAIVSPLNGHADTDIDTAIADVRQHILDLGDLYSGAPPASLPAYRALVETGPNCLPELFEALKNEQQPNVFNTYLALVKRISHFSMFSYSREPLNILGYDLQVSGDVPFFSQELGPNRAYKEPREEKRRKYCEWWAQRQTFLASSERKDKLVALTGTSTKSYAAFDKKKVQEFYQAFKPYGIYNIPLFIDLISNGNNPVAFCDFLRVSDQGEYQTLKMNYDYVENVHKAQAKFPTREEKLKLICAWWKEKSHTYTRLEDLYEAIDSRIKKYCPSE